MGMISNACDGVGARADFAAVKAASLCSIETLVRGWLTSGRRQSDEWVAVNPTRGDKKAGSFSINLRTGVWSDFATGEAGGDMIDLYRYLFGGSLLDAAHEVGRLVGVRPGNRSAEIHTLPITKRPSAVVMPADIVRDPESFPPRTPPDEKGLPKFFPDGDDGPRVHSYEARRHIYKIGTSAVRIKIMRKGDTGAMNWYRVMDGKTSGWQARKPQGFKEVPFVGVLDAFDLEPFEAEQLSKPLYWPEGEKDVETVSQNGGLAFTFGGCGDGLPAGCEEYVRGRHVVILADNDMDGAKHAGKKALLVAPVAASVRVVHFSDLPPKGDVSDFFQRGGTLAKLEQIAAQTPLHVPPANEKPPLDETAKASSSIKATPYNWVEPEAIPKRDFVYGRHLIRKFVSSTVAPGGVGKSSLEITEALAMTSGVALLGVRPDGRSRVWLWNLEDPREEIARHIQATAKHFNLKPSDIDNLLWVDSGRDQRLVMAIEAKEGVKIQEPFVENLVSELLARQIDVLIVDPFVSSHEASENDNPAMDRIVKAWGRVADRANCAIELVHHARKNVSGDQEITVESSRGGKALTDGCRSVRVLNRMTESEAEKAGVDNHRLHFRTYVDKGNLAPPAEKSEWFKLESVDLGNGVNGGFGDSIGVVVPWEWPDSLAGVTGDTVQDVFDVINSGTWRDDVQAAEWVGKAVAKGMKLDLANKADKARAKSIIKIWKEKGSLVTVDGKDNKGRPKKFVEVSEHEK